MGLAKVQKKFHRARSVTATPSRAKIKNVDRNKLKQIIQQTSNIKN